MGSSSWANNGKTLIETIHNIIVILINWWLMESKTCSSRKRGRIHLEHHVQNFSLIGKRLHGRFFAERTSALALRRFGPAWWGAAAGGANTRRRSKMSFVHWLSLETAFHDNRRWIFITSSRHGYLNPSFPDRWRRSWRCPNANTEDKQTRTIAIYCRDAVNTLKLGEATFLVMLSQTSSPLPQASRNPKSTPAFVSQLQLCILYQNPWGMHSCIPFWHPSSMSYS